MKTLYALTVHQPWATAILCNGKDVENRSWASPAWLIGKRLAIHAGKMFDTQAAAWCLGNGIALDSPTEYYLLDGCGIATVVVKGCVQNSTSRWAVPGQWHWLLTEAVHCGPHRARGMHGLWPWRSVFADNLVAMMERHRPQEVVDRPDKPARKVRKLVEGACHE